MKLFSVLITILACVLCTSSATAQEESETQWTTDLVKNVYQPLHRDFSEAAQTWLREAADLCEQRPASNIYKMQVQFTHVIEKFSAIELFRLGPLLEDNRQYRLFFWPGRKGVAERQLRALLRSTDLNRLSAGTLAEKSVAVQGLTALERLLFDVDHQPIETGAPCVLIPVIIENVANMAGELETLWHSDSGVVQALLQPQSDSPLFRDVEDVTRSVFTQVKVGLDVVLEEKLRPLLSNDPKRVLQAPLWLSQRTVPMLTGNIRSLQALLFDSGVLDDENIEQELSVEFQYLESVLADLKPIVYFVEPDGKLTKEVRVLMHKLAAVLAGVRYTIDTHFSQVLGISAGFNSADGD